MIFKPMLATDAVLEKLRFPLLASPKLDGVRAVVRDGIVYSRSNKPIPNKYVQELFGHAYLNGYDGELIVGAPTSKTVYRDTVSEVMSHDKTNGAQFYVFDHVGNMAQPYKHRREAITRESDIMFLHDQRQLFELEALLAYENQCLELGYEGLILRDPNAPYKCGRSTVNEGYLLKMKRFTDAEFEVIGFEERMHNGNEATTNELGRTKRSSHAAGKTGLGDLGALVVKTIDGIEFRVGTGFDDAERDNVWRHRDQYLGSLAKVKYFAVGMKDAPRHPVFLGWRDRSDL